MLGLGHCRSGSGPIPTNAFDALLARVEKGDGPETLPAVPLSLKTCICQLVSKYDGKGDPKVASSYPLRRLKSDSIRSNIQGKMMPTVFVIVGYIVTQSYPTQNHYWGTKGTTRLSGGPSLTSGSPYHRQPCGVQFQLESSTPTTSIELSIFPRRHSRT